MQRRAQVMPTTPDVARLHGPGGPHDHAPSWRAAQTQHRPCRAGRRGTAPAALFPARGGPHGAWGSI